jgi:hypothetical protein
VEVGFCAFTSLEFLLKLPVEELVEVAEELRKTAEKHRS